VILGVHIIGTDACELVHYGMDLVAKQATLFEVVDAPSRRLGARARARASEPEP